MLQELLSLVQNPVFGSRDANMADENCYNPMAEEYTVYMTQMVDVLRACAKQLPQVRPVCLGRCPAPHEVFNPG